MKFSAEPSRDQFGPPHATERANRDGGRQGLATAFAPAPLMRAVPDARRTYQALLQTVSTAFLSGPPILRLKVETTNHNGAAKLFEYGFRLGRPGRPLVFLIPGFGCPIEHKTVAYVSHHLQLRGNHVVALHSPAHPEFLTSSHHSGISGIATDDGRDCLTGIRAICNQLRRQGLLFGDIHLVGYSMGALNAAFARHLDEDDLFKRVVLVNPPVDLAYGMHQLDALLAAVAMPAMAKAKLVAKVGLAIALPKKLRLHHGAGCARVIRAFLSRPIWTENEMRAMIGHSFSITVSGGIDVATRLRLFPENHSVRSFGDYCRTATIAAYREKFSGHSLDEFFRDESLLTIGPPLAARGHIRVLHNEDDFLLRPQDVAWLRKTFGADTRLFTSGGHLGNLWRRDFHQALDEALA